jgi:hypothetical protein
VPSSFFFNGTVGAPRDILIAARRGLS